MGTAVVAGRVFDDTTKQPIGGATVVLSAVNPPARQGGPPSTTRRAVAVVDANGRFVFRGLPAGTYSLAATLNGYSPGAHGRVRPGGPTTNLDIADDVTRTDLVIPLWKLGAIAGTVRDDLGHPVVGVSVWAYRRDNAGGRIEYSFSGGSVEATDERGAYRISSLAPGTYVIVVRTATQSNPAAAVHASLRGFAETGRIPRSREAMETGAIQIERSGLAIDGWQASVSISSPQPLPGPNGTLLVPATTFYPGVRDMAAATPITLEPGTSRPGADFTLPYVTGVRLSGTLLGPSGPASGHGIRLVPADTDDRPGLSSPVAYATTDDAGRFSLLGVPSGSYQLTAYRNPLTADSARMFSSMTATRIDVDPSAVAMYGELPVSVGDRHVDGLALTLQPNAGVSGRVVFEGAARPPAEQIVRTSLTLNTPAGGATGGQTRVQDDGTFEITVRTPGHYLVTATGAPAGWTLTSARIAGRETIGRAVEIGREDFENVVLTFTDTPITVSGSIRTSDNQPAQHASVVLMPADTRTWMATGMAGDWSRIVAANALGEFQIVAALPGDYLIVAVPSDVEPTTVVSPSTLDLDFVAEYSALGQRVTLALGDSKTINLTVRRPQ
jgi:protocatechuate 3,4-dioxygenase beta subunit